MVLPSRSAIVLIGESGLTISTSVNVRGVAMPAGAKTFTSKPFSRAVASDAMFDAPT